MSWTRFWGGEKKKKQVFFFFFFGGGGGGGGGWGFMVGGWWRGAGCAIEDEGVAFGLEAAFHGGGFDVFAPELDGELVGDELALAGILEEGATEGVIHAQIAEDGTAGAMEEIGDAAEDLALGALAGARRAEEKDGAIFHRFQASLCLTWTSLISVKGILSSIDPPPFMTWRCISRS